MIFSKILKAQLFYRARLIVVITWSLCNAAHAMSSISDGNLLITLRDGLPCFFYPMDSFTGEEEYFLGTLSISWNDRAASLPPHDIWVVNGPMDNSVSPSDPLACIPYGDLTSGATQNSPAKLHRYDVPYYAHMSVFTAKGRNRKYLVRYCLARDSAGKPMIESAKFNDGTSRFDCKKP